MTKGKLGFMNGKLITRPIEVATDFEAWMENIVMIRARGLLRLTRNSISKLKGVFGFVANANEMWEV